MRNFFVDSSPYQWPHIIILIIFLVVTVALIVLTKVFAKTDKQQVWVIKISAGAVLLLTILSRFIYNDFKPSLIDFLPSSFCSIMGFVLPLFILFCKKDSKTLFYAVFAGFMGGLITILSGDDIGQARIQNTFISYAYHSGMVSLALLCFFTKYCTPTLNKVPRLATGLSFMAIYGLFSNQVFDYSNNMFLNSPIIGGITWWLCGIILIAIAIVLALIYEACTRKWKDQNLYLAYKKTKNYFTFSKKQK